MGDSKKLSKELEEVHLMDNGAVTPFNSAPDLGRVEPRPVAVPPTGDAEIRCALCGRNFRSWKSVYGHMRSHSSRKAKASPPESSKQISAAASESECSSAVPPQMTTTRSTTAQRGGEGIKASEASKDLEMSDDSSYDSMEYSVECAAGNLMLLRSATWTATPPTMVGGLVVSEEGPITPVSTSSGSNIRSADTDVSHQDGDEEPPAAETQGLLLSHSTTTAGERKQGAGLGYLTVTGGIRKMYRCATCNRSFSSHQALGGHRASHWKSVGRDHQPGVIATPAASDDDDDRSKHSGSPDQVGSPKPVEHRCNQCGSVFPTGQALGGHKRKHWDGLKNHASATALPSGNNNNNNNNNTHVEKSASADIFVHKSPSSAARIWDIDLNEPAPTEEEEVVEEEEIGDRLKKQN